jgi:hypothetical protein
MLLLHVKGDWLNAGASARVAFLAKLNGKTKQLPFEDQLV